MASLKEELEKLTNPAPIFNDPEEDTDGITICLFYILRLLVRANRE